MQMTGAGMETLSNLQEAFNGETNAAARYLAFAGKADAEGYGPVTSLFRAAARAEQIHAGNHAAVIRGLGAEPAAEICTPVPGGTRENLEAAIRGETYELDVMYPRFIARAEAEGSHAAVNTFRLAMEVEGGHARLYTEALNSLEALRGPGVAYYVGPVCGFTTPSLDSPDCPVCATPGEMFEAVG